MKWEHGHVECIALATDKSIAEKYMYIATVDA